MAKSNSNRRKHGKPKFIEIDGHRLTPAMHADYERCVESKADALAGRGTTAGEVERLALADFLAGYRPSRKIGRQLLELSCQSSRVAVALGTMQEYMWAQTNPIAIRSAGVDLVKKLALELYNASAKLMAIALNVEAEADTKLQDWIAREDEIASAEKIALVLGTGIKIGRTAEKAHG